MPIFVEDLLKSQYTAYFPAPYVDNQLLCSLCGPEVESCL